MSQKVRNWRIYPKFNFSQDKLSKCVIRIELGAVITIFNLNEDYGYFLLKTIIKQNCQFRIKLATENNIRNLLH